MIIDPAIEELLVSYLRTNLPTWGFTMPVGTTVPTPRPTESVVVFRTGGPRRDMVTDNPQVTVDVRAGTEKRARRIIQVVRGLVNDLEDTDDDEFPDNPVYQVLELSGPANLPDPIAGIRYTQSFSIAIRSSESVPE